MTKPTRIYDQIRHALETAPRNAYMGEMHLQALKYMESLKDVSGKEFCEEIQVSPAFATEFLKMKKIFPRLVKAGLDPEEI